MHFMGITVELPGLLPENGIEERGLADALVTV
jgi:hypothetical protein